MTIWFPLNISKTDDNGFSSINGVTNGPVSGVRFGYIVKEREGVSNRRGKITSSRILNGDNPQGAFMGEPENWRK